AAKERGEQLTGELQRGLDEIVKLGGAPKDLGLGLVDFLYLRNGEEVNLCWKYGERAITHCHGLDEGYAGRKTLPCATARSSSISSTRWFASSVSACPRSKSTASSSVRRPACCTASCKSRRPRSAWRHATRRSARAGGRPSVCARSTTARSPRQTASPTSSASSGSTKPRCPRASDAR